MGYYFSPTMPGPDFRDLQSIRIDPELLSRGTGQSVLLQDSVVYDFMLPILGNRFRVDPILNRGVHFFSDSGSFMQGEEAFHELATNEINAGNLVPALEAYKRSLHKAVGFAGAMAMLGDAALLSPAEIDRFNLQNRFGGIERGMIRMIIATGDDTKVNLPEYTEWVTEVRTLQRESRVLGSQFHWAVQKHPEDKNMDPSHPDYWDKSLVGDPKIGKRLLEDYIQMQQYKLAAGVAERLGDAEGQAKYTELAKTDPQDPPGYKKILWRIQEEDDRSRGYR